MLQWVTFGASTIGPAHVITGKPNQDSWASFHRSNYDVLAVSDGLGSKTFSELGSVAACRAVDAAARSAKHNIGTIDLTSDEGKAFFFDDLLNAWLSEISPINADDACATCLFAIRDEETIWLGMLGDGAIAIILGDGSIRICQEEKDESFSNMTISLSQSTRPSDWVVSSVPSDDCRAILMCTDGVSDDLIDVEGFAGGLVSYLSEMPTSSASSRLYEILNEWPTPKHSDDKTIACMMRRDFEDE